MSEDTTGTGVQATPPVPPAGQVPPPSASTPPTGPQTLEEALAIIEKERKERQDANREAQTHRSRLRELETADEERKKAAMSEQERIVAERDELAKAKADLESQLQAVKVKTTVMSVATQAGAIDPDAVYALLDHSALEFKTDGTPKNADALVKALLEAKPYLVRGASSGTNAANAGRGNGSALSSVEESRRRLRGDDVDVWAPRKV